MDVVPDTTNRRPQRIRRPPQNRTQESPPKARKTKSTANRPIAPPDNNEINDNIERRKAAAILSVRNFVSSRNLIVPTIQERIVPPIEERIVPLPRAVVRRVIRDRVPLVPIAVNAEEQRLNAEQRRANLLAAVRNHVVNININHPPIVDPVVEIMDPLEIRMNEIQARDKMKADLILAGTGIMPDTLLIEQIAIKNSINKFIITINTAKLATCKYCEERWFSDGGKFFPNNEFVCKDDLPGHNKSKKTNIPYVAKMSKENNMDPYYHSNPQAMEDYRALKLLPKPTKIECALISKQKVIMKIFKLKGPIGGSNYGTVGNVVNISQDLGPLCLNLPRLVTNSGFFSVRSKCGQDAGDYKDFKVRRYIVYAWLRFLKKWNIAYKDIEIDMNNLNLLPEDDSVFNQLPILEEEPELPGDNNIEQNRVENNDDEGGVEDGPINDIDLDEDNILESSVGIQEISNDEAQDIVDIILEPVIVIPRNENMDPIEAPNAINQRLNNIDDIEVPILPQIIPPDVNIPLNWPEFGLNAVDEYNTTNFFSLMNPYLFPFGTGDCTDKIRIYDVSLHDSIKHYQRFSLYDDIKKQWYWPFAENHAFMHCCQDMDERRRIQSQCSIFLEKNPSTSNLLIEELREMARDSNSHSSFVTDQRMQRYGANILGTYILYLRHIYISFTFV
jgi:hypothetical protein